MTATYSIYLPIEKRKMVKYLLIVFLLISCMTACNLNDKTKETNPLLAEWNTPHQTPPFGEIKHEHFIPAIDATLKEAKEEVDRIISSTEAPTFQNTIVALEVSGEKLDGLKVWWLI